MITLFERYTGASVPRRDSMSRETIVTDSAPKPGGAYSQGIRWGDLVFTAGQVAVDPAAGKPVEGGVREQTRQVLHNVRAVLEAGGSSLDAVLKTTCFLADMNDFPAFNEVYREFFPTDPPARSTVGVALASPWVVEIEAVGVRVTG
jgi:2-iminobutanoate/2-iminopropanoate deaminase